MKKRHAFALLLLALLLGAGLSQVSVQAAGQWTSIFGGTETVALPAGTAFTVRLTTGVNSRSHKAGDTFEGTLDRPVVIGGKEVVPKGAEVTGKVTSAVPSGRLKQRAELWVTLTRVKVGGKSYDVITTTTGRKEGSKAKRDVLMIGGGAGTGAAIGGIAGGGRGAAIGAAVGAGGGTAAAAATGKRDINFPPETVLRFRLKEEVKVEVKK